MTQLKDVIKIDDWKKEKHVPVISLDRKKLNKGEFFGIEVSVGKGIEHPNTTAHHIRWISIYFLPDNEEFPYHIADATFNAHGESVKGADTSTIYSNHTVKVEFKTEKDGTIMAASYCNIHGLWQNSVKIQVL
ncbi:MAG: desulfoferrodoxin family protein [Nitrososphaeraceae archaeon]